MKTPITRYIESKSGARVVIGEHPDSLFLAADRAGFYTREQVWEMIVALWQIHRRLPKP